MMNIKFEISRLENSDVIATSHYSYCIRVNDIDVAECDLYISNTLLKGQDFPTEVYNSMKALNGGEDLAEETWYAVYLDDDGNATSIKKHTEIGHSDHKED